MERDVGISKYKFLYVEWLNNKVLLYSTEDYMQYPMINHNGNEYFTKKVYIYTCMAESLCYKAVINTILYINYTSIQKFLCCMF